MPIKVACPNPDCKAEYQVPQDRLGKSAKCSQCGLTFTQLISADETAAPNRRVPAAVPSPNKSLLWAAPLESPPPKPAGGSAGRRQAAAVELPAKIGQYQIKRLLGAGAMGRVYLAHDPHLDRDVAIKVLPSGLTDDEERVSRFLREARLTAKVQHPNTVVIYQVMVEEGLASIAMELVDGGSLDDIVEKQGPMPWREATRTIRDAAAGLGAAHEMGLVHRDVKPANLMRTCKGTVKVVDFGLVRAMQSTSQLTQLGTILGTPTYMAPEQWTGQEANARSDLYSLVCTYYYLLTGQEPFAAASIPALGYQHRYEPFPDARKLVSDLPTAACRILARGTEKEPVARFQTAAELIAAMDELLAMKVEEEYEELLDREKILDATVPEERPASEPQPAIASQVCLDEILDVQVCFDEILDLQEIARPTAHEEQPASKWQPLVFSPPNFDEIIDEAGIVNPASGATAPKDPLASEWQTVAPQQSARHSQVPACVRFAPTNGRPQQSARHSQVPEETSAPVETELDWLGNWIWLGMKILISLTSAGMILIAIIGWITGGDKATPYQLTPVPVLEETTLDLKLDLVLIPAGSFTMGDASDKPAHKVTITKPFYLGKYEVTQEQWEAVMGNNPSNFKGPKNPVECVSWDDCQQFLVKLNAKAGGQGGKFVLPTEAQWEYACRAGGTGKFCFGDDEARLGDYAWYSENSGSKTHPVGEKKPNAFGLYDMHGNVLEWCQDWNGTYGAGVTDPSGPTTGSSRGQRGGGWYFSAGLCRSADRYGSAPGHRIYYLGLRVARVPADTGNEPRLTEQLKIKPIPPQTVEAGKRLQLAMTLENHDSWRGKLRYGLARQPPPGTTINPQSGEFSWTPPPDQATGNYNVTVSVQATGGQKAQTTFVITVKPVLEETTLDLGNDVKLDMVLIPAGSFTMGDDSEKPVNKVTITKPFYLGKYEVTQEQWEAVMGNNPSIFKGPKNPVECVSWDDCQQFLVELNAKTGGRGGKFVLPTEAQWEYACRAGGTGKFCFGNEEEQLGEYAWYDKNSDSKTHPVGEKKPNAFGLYDIHGNVREWCQDWYGAYNAETVDDPRGPTTGTNRVYRGGSWSDRGQSAHLLDDGEPGDRIIGFELFDRAATSAYRNYFEPGCRCGTLGLRVARVPAD